MAFQAVKLLIRSVMTSHSRLNGPVTRRHALLSQATNCGGEFLTLFTLRR